MTRTDAAGEVAALADLSREKLIARWAALHGKAPPRTAQDRTLGILGRIGSTDTGNGREATK